MSFIVTAQGDVERHINITSPYDNSRFPGEDGLPTTYVSLDIFEHDTFDEWLKRVCKTAGCEQRLTRSFVSDEQFTGRFLPTGLPDLAHKGMLLPNKGLPASASSVFGPGFPLDLGARQVAMIKQSSELTQYLQQLQVANGWKMENGFYMEGGVFELPAMRDIVFNMAAKKNSNMVCEIGFNTGHSALMWLLANSYTQVVSFDIMRHPYNSAAAEYLQNRFPNRLEVIEGNSTQSVRKFAAANTHRKCDIVFIDGDHNYDVPFLDIESLREMSHESTLLLMDDLYCGQAYWCDGPSGGWHKAMRKGLLREFECFLNEPVKRGLCTGQYLFDDASVPRPYVNWQSV